MSEESSQSLSGLARWQDLNAQADAGTITIPAEVAARCDAACAQYLIHLTQMKRDATRLGAVKAFGDLPSAQALRAKFVRMATGTPGSLDAIFQQHIDIVESMRLLFRRYFDDHTSIDDQTATKISALNPEN